MMDQEMDAGTVTEFKIPIEVIRHQRVNELMSVKCDEMTVNGASNSESTSFLTASCSGSNNNNNTINNKEYTDTITSNRSRHLSFTRLAYNLSTFNEEFDRIKKERTNNPFLKIVSDTRSLVRSISNRSLNRNPGSGDRTTRGGGGDVSPTNSGYEDDDDDGNDDEVRQDMNRHDGPKYWNEEEDESDVAFSFKSCFQAFGCSKKKLLSLLISLFPIIKWSSEYNVSQNLIPDLIAGLTIIVFHVPQSMGYSLIAHVSPVYGLYTAFFPALIYSVMGTSRHCAIGMFAVISLMTGTLITEAKEEMAFMKSLSSITSESRSSPDLLVTTGSPTESLMQVDENGINIQIAIAVSFLIGMYQLVFGIMQMGFISVYLSEQLVSGFTTAASLYVFTSQLPFLFGVHLPHRSGPLALIYAYTDLMAHLSEINLYTLSISLTCCTILLISKTYVNEKIKHKWKINIPFPIELVLVIIGTLVSHFCGLDEYHIAVVGPIPSGLPQPVVPDWSLMMIVAKKSIPLAIVAYTLTISVGKIFATRHGYEIDPNQELLALGFLNLFSSFFACLPSAASLSRSAVQESAGGRTQLVSIINCIGILLVLYFAGSLLQQLPICILASIIAVALKSLIYQMQDFLRYWKVSKLDSSIWLITFIAVILLDVDLGLYVGLGYSLLTLIYKSQRPKTYLLGSVGASDVYVPERKYASAVRIPDILIYQFCGPLHFANTEFFRKDLVQKIGVSVAEVRKQQQQEKLKQLPSHKPHHNLKKEEDEKRERRIHCSNVTGDGSELLDLPVQTSLATGNEGESVLGPVLLLSKEGAQKRVNEKKDDKRLQGRSDIEEGRSPFKDHTRRREVERSDDEEEVDEKRQQQESSKKQDQEEEDVKKRCGKSLPTHVIIDCSMFSYIDTAGVSTLKTTVQDYESIGIKTLLTGIATHVDNMLELDGFYREIPPHHVYITIHDAVHHAQQDQLGFGLHDDDFVTLESPDCHSNGQKAAKGRKVFPSDHHQLSGAADPMNLLTDRANNQINNTDSSCYKISGIRSLSNNNNDKYSSSLPPSTPFDKTRKSIVGFFESSLPAPQHQGQHDDQKLEDPES